LFSVFKQTYENHCKTKIGLTHANSDFTDVKIISWKIEKGSWSVEAFCCYNI